MTFLSSLIRELGAMALFGWLATRKLFRHGVSVPAVLDQMFTVGVRSLPVTIATGMFVGAIMAIQLNLQLRDFGAEGFLGGLSTSVTIRNVGPVLIAFILSGKVGAYTSAELGTMQVTEQVAALRCLGADPIRYLVVPRLVAVVLTSFLLLIIGLVMAIAGGTLIASMQLGVNASNYAAGIGNLVGWWSVGTGVVKSFFFGGILAVICCYQGYHATGGAAGVGATVKRTAVQTLVSIIVADFALSSVSGAFASLLGGAP